MSSASLIQLIYAADFDTKCLKSIEGWHRPPWLRMLSIFEDEPRRDPAIIVGIEVDVGSRPDWHAWWPRPLGIVQWTMASTKGHPILIDTMRRVVEAIDQTNSSALSVEGQHRTLDAIVEMTGPAPFTDSVLRCESSQSILILCVTCTPRTDNGYLCRPWSQVQRHLA